MISSMTGYGHGEVVREGITAMADVRSVNNRFLEIVTRLPQSLLLRENNLKEVVRNKISRGKVNIAITIEHENQEEIPLRINRSAARAYYKLLTELRKSVNIRSPISLEHLLQFSDVIEIQEADLGSEKEWIVAEKALTEALDGLVTMRMNEGAELKNDMVPRIHLLGRLIDEIEQMSLRRIPEERTRLYARVEQLLQDKSVVDKQRLELELVLLADKLDVTEECVRFRSHNKFFLDAIAGDEAVGRKLNFLQQEMNREANTIGSKSSDAEISQKVVKMKEELEKIREQLQNIE